MHMTPVFLLEQLIMRIYITAHKPGEAGLQDCVHACKKVESHVLNEMLIDELYSARPGPQGRAAVFYLSE